MSATLTGRHRPEAPPAVGEQVRLPGRATRDDRLTYGGAAVASLSTTWLAYTQILPFTGRLGFVVCWYVLFVAFLGVLTAQSRPRAIMVDRVVTAIVVAAPVIVGIALTTTIISTVIKGWEPLTHVNFYTDDMAGVRATDSFDQGGILHAITGTLIEVTIAVAIAMPLGVITAIFTSEVGGRAARWVRAVVEALTAMPSIVAGLFVYTVCIVHLGMPTSGFAASLALSVMALPIMARASDVVLRVVPNGLREASYALGATKWQTVWRVVLPTARPGLATALILGVARTVGETAPLLLTSGASTYFTANPLEVPMNSLPLYIYTAVSSGSPEFEERGYAAAAVLLIIVLILFVVARLVARRKPGNR